MDRAQLGEAVALAQMHAGGLVFADPVQGDDDRPLEGRGVEGRGGVRAVVLGILDRAVKAEMLPDLLGDRHLVMHETWDVALVDAPGTRPVIDHLVPQPVQLRVRVLVEDDAVDLADAQTGGLQRAADSEHRKAGIVLHPAQPLLVNGEANRLVVDVSGEELRANRHRTLPQRLTRNTGGRIAGLAQG